MYTHMYIYIYIHIYIYLHLRILKGQLTAESTAYNRYHTDCREFSPSEHYEKAAHYKIYYVIQP